MSRLSLPSCDSPEVAASIEKWLGGNDRPAPLIFRIFHLHPQLASRAGVLGAGFLGHHLLPLRDREMAIDRVTGRLGAVHEWGLHATTFGETAGLNARQLMSTVEGPRLRPDLWSVDDLRFFDAVDELAETADLGDSSWNWLSERYDQPQMIEFLLLVGWYRTVASVCNAVRIEADPLSMPFPSADEGDARQQPDGWARQGESP